MSRVTWARRSGPCSEPLPGRRAGGRAANLRRAAAVLPGAGRRDFRLGRLGGALGPIHLHLRFPACPLLRTTDRVDRRDVRRWSRATRSALLARTGCRRARRPLRGSAGGASSKVSTCKATSSCVSKTLTACSCTTLRVRESRSSASAKWRWRERQEATPTKIVGRRTDRKQSTWRGRKPGILSLAGFLLDNGRALLATLDTGS